MSLVSNLSISYRVYLVLRFNPFNSEEFPINRLEIEPVFPYNKNVEQKWDFSELLAHTERVEKTHIR